MRCKAQLACSPPGANAPAKLIGPMCISARQVEPLLSYSDLTVCKMAAVRHLGFLESQILAADTIQKVNRPMRHRAKFHSDRSGRC